MRANRANTALRSSSHSSKKSRSAPAALRPEPLAASTGSVGNQPADHAIGTADGVVDAADVEGDGLPVDNLPAAAGGTAEPAAGNWAGERTASGGLASASR